MWKDFLYFTKSEKRSIILLIVLIIVAVSAGYLFELLRKKDSQQSYGNLKQEYAGFIEGLKQDEKTNNTAGSQTYASQTAAPVLSAFDPNTADSLTFVRLGLPSWMAGNIIRYRAQGGKFRKAEDFMKIYGLSREQYQTLQPYISIAREPALAEEFKHPPVEQEQKAEHTFHGTTKYPLGTVINLNEADTAELKKIPGIGNAISGRIVAYRKRLGGFYSVEQLAEINLDTQKLSAWFAVNESSVSRINLNTASIEKLRNHPYINFYQAKAIVEFRNKRGHIAGLEQLVLLEEFNNGDFERLKHYVCF